MRDGLAGSHNDLNVSPLRDFRAFESYDPFSFFLSFFSSGNLQRTSIRMGPVEEVGEEWYPLAVSSTSPSNNQQSWEDFKKGISIHADHVFFPF